MPTSSDDAEIHAIQAIVSSLEPLDPDARSRVLAYAFARLGLDSAPALASRAPTPGEPVALPPDAPPQPVCTQDIRTLHDEKQPRSANEMAAVVAYYLAEVAPTDERKEYVTTSDVQKYFKQAKHPLPRVPGQTLKNAAAAGYLDSAGSGRYRLNPVGHNLVAHSLPREGTGQPARPTKRTRTKPDAKKSTGARKTTSRSSSRAPKSAAGRKGK